eukprot:TRINITY_DN20743_c0_g1_i1.p1 TRINITY_DN20743_c0_g1~~TRINITY_DN20743_c0_g1_i1.p1  ORF type:complete len:708 (+),score=101.61 TRINITY_DN20743_c0_g1_i1:53-2125(+)
MAGLDHVDQSADEFHDTVDKDVVVEASHDAWYRPQVGDMVVLEVRPEGSGLEKFTRRWAVGQGPPLLVSGLDLDLCVQTMRRGEEALMKRKGAAEPSQVVRLRLHSLERTEDLLGNGNLQRTTLQDGTGWKMPQVGNELFIRYSWRHVASSSSPSANYADVQPEPTVCTVLLSASSEDSLAPSRELNDLLRSMMQRFGGAVETRVRADATGSSREHLVLEIKRGSEILASSAEGMRVDDARSAISNVLLPTASTMSSANSTGSVPKEAMIKFEEGACKCDAPDWMPGFAGFRVLSDLREGQRCLVRIAPELMSAKLSGQTELSLPAGQQLEYDVELIRIHALEDVSLGKDRSVMKKLIKDGEGVERPTEGSDVKVRIGARSDPDGAVLLEERDLAFQSASDAYCSAISETVLTMKRGEICEVRCVDPAAWVDQGLGLCENAHVSVVVFTLELLELQVVDVYTMEEIERVEYCSRRKELGTKFFSAKQWTRALKRYVHVTTTLKYTDHWKDVSAKEAAVPLRRACHLNAAACWLKLSKWPEARDACDAVLKVEQSNAKALFRKAQALKEMGDNAEAERCLRKVYDLDPSDQQVVRLLRTVRQSLKEENAQQKNMFSRMAKGIGAGETSANAIVGSETDAQEVDRAAGIVASKHTPSTTSSSSSSSVLWAVAIVGIAAAALVGVSVARSRKR